MGARQLHRRWSTYAGILAWGASGFMAYPSLASGLYHLTVLPLALAATILLARWEGRRDAGGASPLEGS